MMNKLFALILLFASLESQAKTAYQAYTMPATGNVSIWGPIHLDQTAAVTGVLPLVNGGTGTTTGAIPAGALFDFAGTVVPTGYLPCDGSAVSRTTYAALFTAIGTTWGVGDGSTTFNVPNFQRRVAVGSGGSGTGVLGNTVGSTGGEETHVQTLSELATHSHTGTATVSPIQIITENSGVSPGTPIGLSGSHPQRVAVNTASTGYLSNDIIVPNSSYPLTIANAGSSTAFNQLQPSAVVLKMIKY